MHNNAIFLKKKPAAGAVTKIKNKARKNEVKGNSVAGDEGTESGVGVEEEKDGHKEFIHPHDRNGKIMRNRYTTSRVEEALVAYLSAAEDTMVAVRKALQGLSDTLVANNDLPAIAQAAHWAVICQALEGHVRRSISNGWTLPTLKSADDSDMTLLLVEELLPYWLQRGRGVPNSFDFRGLFLLTAPNMSGKSTLMRATLSAALLSNAGLCAPCRSATVPRYDGFFLRTASFDVPSEGKSAFALEMDDVRSDNENPKWTYTMEEGKCTDSLALQVRSRQNWDLVYGQMCFEFGLMQGSGCRTWSRFRV
ncbi:unnamed protein product [Choristocarpus tenellus]